MANRFRTNLLLVSGKDFSIDLNDQTNYWRHDGSFQNPIVGLSTSGNVQNTGSILDNKINLLSGNIYNNIVDFAGAGSVSVTTGSGTWYISGVNYQPQIDSVTQITGNFYFKSNPNGYATSGNIASTGSSLQSQINLLNNKTGTYLTGFNSGQYMTGFNSGQYLTGLIAGTNITVLNNNNGSFTVNSAAVGGGGAAITGISITGSDYTSGFNGQFTLTGGGNTSIFFNSLNQIIISGAISSGAAAVDSLSGYIYSNYVDLIGTGIVTIITGSGVLYISGAASDSNGINLSGNLTSTGIILMDYINSLSGAEDTKINNINNLTGSFYPTNNPNNFANSGNVQSTGQILYNYITNFSGVFNNSGSQYQTQITNIKNVTGNFSSLTVSGSTRFQTPDISGVYISVGKIGDNNILVSGQPLIKSLTLDSPTERENICMFYNPTTIYPQKIITICNGITPLIGWSLYQTTSRDVLQTLIKSGFANTTTTGITHTNFNLPVISGNTFVIFTSQITGGSALNGFNLTLIHS